MSNESENAERFRWFALGATTIQLDDGKNEWDIWLSVTPNYDINIYADGEHYGAVVYKVKNGVVDTTNEYELFKRKLP
jgi:hypothetical protein